MHGEGHMRGQGHKYVSVVPPIEEREDVMSSPGDEFGCTEDAPGISLGDITRDPGVTNMMNWYHIVRGGKM